MVVAMEFVEADLFMFVLLFVEGGGMVVVDADRRWCVMLSKVYREHRIVTRHFLWCLGESAQPYRCRLGLF